MRVQIRFRGLRGTQELREYVMRRIGFQLSRFGDKLSGVVVRIADINGPKGGVDKECQVTVHGAQIGTSTLTELGTTSFGAVDAAVERMGRSVSRSIERTQNWNRGRLWRGV